MIPLGISTLAWLADDTEDALRMLSLIGYDAVEVAPAQLLGDQWTGPKGIETAHHLRDLLEHRGLMCSAMQGILFGVEDVELFASSHSRDNLRRHLRHVAKLARILGAKVCVFGAPKQRQIGNLSLGEAHVIAEKFFSDAAPEFAGRGVVLAFEANPKQYGCDFITTTPEAVDLVGAVGQHGFGLQLDTGTMIMNCEMPRMLIGALEHAVHLHISEPELRPLSSGSLWRDCHADIANTLHAMGYFGPVPGAGEFDCARQPGSISVEMKAAPDWRAALIVAAGFVRTNYLTPPT